MEYKRIDNTVILRVDRGEEVLTALKEVALKEDIKLASVTGLGACDHFVAGVYKVDTAEYVKNEFNGVYEITSLVGTINTMNGEYYSHIHITCGDELGHAFGGHLNEVRISVTCEIVINIINGIVDRKKDEVTGLNIFKF